MHLLAAKPGAIEEGSDPVDLGQTPADIVFLTAADSEIAALSEAHAQLGEKAASLRLANIMHLRHPMSVDLHIDSCASKSRLVIARILGGAGYWKYGLEQCAARLRKSGVMFAALPGDDQPDAELWGASSVTREDWQALHAYLVEGGPKNAAGFLLYAKSMIHGGEHPAAAKPLLRAGLHWPGSEAADIEEIKKSWAENAPVVPIVFYRALAQGAGLNPINRMTKALLKKGLNPLPVFVASLKDPVSAATLERLFAENPPEVILNCTGFAVGSLDRGGNGPGVSNPLSGPASNHSVTLQTVLAGSAEADWESGASGLSARDLAMNVALPEVDGRILSRAVSFKGEAFYDRDTECSVVSYRARGDRISFVADLAAAWARLRRVENSEKRIALILSNYPNKDGRLANGVGLDTPASTVEALRFLKAKGFRVSGAPEDPADLMKRILKGPTNWLADRAGRRGGARLGLDEYLERYCELPWEIRSRIEERWGPPENDPFLGDGGFALSALEFDNAAVAVQPARGYNIDPRETYHAPDLAPPHNYMAFYVWLRDSFGAHAIVHMGKHGNLEWLPGKALALSENCFPEAALGPVPCIYPFIVNDPGEGTQAKRRISAAVVDHLTPPLARAETYGPLRDLEALVDEYYEASGLDARRRDHIRREILTLASSASLDMDAGLEGDDIESDLAKLDAYLCDLKEAQIRDGLHVFGKSPEGALERDLVQALMRVPRGDGSGKDASLTRAISEDFGLGFDPLDADMARAWQGPRPDPLMRMTRDMWRTEGDTVERLELFAAAMLDGEENPPGPASAAVLKEASETARPCLAASGPAELEGMLSGIRGEFIEPGPSGAPTRGRLDVIPTGRNFYSVDSRAIPTRSAWALGWKSAALLVERHLQDHGDWPRAMLLTAWGTANMRTGGDDIAQALALMGVKPRWDGSSHRVAGFDILPLDDLGRPRVDVTLRVSGFFRDSFPSQIDLVDAAARAVMGLDEPADQNPAAHRYKTEEGEMAGFRVFGSMPGAYGAGLQAMIDERIWSGRGDLAQAYLTWGCYAYGQRGEGREAEGALRKRLSQVEAIVQNQDNREHDVLDSDDYYQFEGGAAAAVAEIQGVDRVIYHNDHSRPERPVIRTLDDEIGRVVRSRAVNPKWIEGVKRHGYKGAFEMAATVDYLFAFAATTRAVRGHHFDLALGAFLGDEGTRAFIEESNPDALREMAERFIEAIERGLWTPRLNSARSLLEDILSAWPAKRAASPAAEDSPPKKRLQIP